MMSRTMSPVLSWPGSSLLTALYRTCEKRCLAWHQSQARRAARTRAARVMVSQGAASPHSSAGHQGCRQSLLVPRFWQGRAELLAVRWELVSRPG